LGEFEVFRRNWENAAKVPGDTGVQGSSRGLTRILTKP
jgi:hypothetical protein